MKTASSANWKRIAALICVAGLGVATALLAEDPVRRNPNPEEGAAQFNENLDAHFAACLILSNQNEVTIARLAEQRTKNPEVKKFAEKLQKDHQQFIGDLDRFAGAYGFPGRMPPENEDDANKRHAMSVAQQRLGHAGQTPVMEPGQRLTVALFAMSPHEMHLQIKREIADECLLSAEDELRTKEGREFDACFVGMQMGAHMYLLDVLKVFERHASPALQKVLRKDRETTQTHLDQSRELMKNIGQHETRTTAKSQ